MMKKFVPGSQGIYVTSSCEFSQWPSEECDLPMRDNLITINLYGETHTLDKTWVMLLAMFEIQDRDAIQNVRFVKLPYSKYEVPWRAVYRSPRYIDPEKRYRKIPGYPRVSVSIDGICVDNTTQQQLKPTIDTYGYHVLQVYDSLRCSRVTLGIHRLVALAWLVDDFFEPNVIVNHKDGNKINNHAHNLEWTTFYGNNIHAIKTGLRERCCSCRVRDIETEEIIEFPSIQETATFLGYKRTAKDSKLFGSTFINKLYNGKYELRVEGDDRPWFYTKDKQIMSTTPSYNVISILDNGITKVFHGARDIIKHYKVWNAGGGLDSVLNKLKIIRPDLEILDVIKPDIVSSVQIKEISTGVVTEYPSIRALERALGYPKVMLDLVIKYNGSKEYHGYVMRYTSDEPWPEILENKYKPVKIEVTDLETQEVIEYPSLKAVARSLGIDRKQIKRMLRYQKKGDRWKLKKLQDLSTEGPLKLKDLSEFSLTAGISC